MSIHDNKRPNPTLLWVLLLALGTVSCAADEVASQSDDLVGVQPSDIHIARMKVLEDLHPSTQDKESNFGITGPGWQVALGACERLEDVDPSEWIFDCTNEIEALAQATWQHEKQIPLAHRVLFRAEVDLQKRKVLPRLDCNLAEIDVIIDDDASLKGVEGLGFYFRDSRLDERAWGRFVVRENLHRVDADGGSGSQTTLRFLAVSSCRGLESADAPRSEAQLRPFFRKDEADHWEEQPSNHVFPAADAQQGYEVIL